MERKQRLRSQDWFGSGGKDGFIHRSSMKMQGLPDHVFDGRPVIGICNTWSEFNPCNAGLKGLAEAVKRGIWEAGGLPLEFPVGSLGEDQMRPTAMLFRNLLAMQVEESIRAHGMDGVVLLAGCDKTTPAQLMGAASVDLPTIMISAGPALSGNFRGRTIASGTDVWKFSEEVRAGTMSMKDFVAAESGMSRSVGVCNTMGTASTMASLVEVMGVALPMNSAYPAVDARRFALAHLTGNRIVAMVREDLRLSKILTRASFENAILANAALGGSTNAIVHLLAIAGRIGADLKLDDFNLGSEVPLLVNCLPSGKHLMEEFCNAGGVPAVLAQIKGMLRDALTVEGRSVVEVAAEGECFNDDVIRALDNPVRPKAGIRVLRGNIAPDGAVIKPSAATESLLVHEGEAYVFSSVEEMKTKIDDPDLPVTADTVLVLQGCGPRGYPGMAEVGNMPIPARLVREGVRDMLRISDARMSGTAFGAVVLHVSPETSVGGPLALVKTGDRIRMNAYEGTLELLVSRDELEKRAEAWVQPRTVTPRGFVKLYQDHVMQAHTGADLDFLVGASGDAVVREAH
ncbi:MULTISPECIES: IlvD/Edd family dehydratase [unclassified Shinella]|uniref:IlvD/Edd family dehydratase n=1 Tax=unclassified Shinella TaxID=2643062 RepID=UPI00225D117F|nr:MULTISPECIES: IlvD/Edd family dehydratase [unclassified Shinella]MCO5136744.1 dihydroxy-acid dehydratase [Shinella sp.]MDC7253580.1 dihydroxy-acid dehydratase [Shinella sp. YE25]CAI0336213.1 putative dehydratase IlvD1 [Rhizobiaceae bacterium]CAK7254759.1 putative dehydratase IlvD1 [Shinella sp. WSC3-e]